MDEPTSGLDVMAAAIVMRTVRNIVNTGQTIGCTIHQPSIDIFESFDEVFPISPVSNFIAKQWKKFFALPSLNVSPPRCWIHVEMAVKMMVCPSILHLEETPLRTGNQTNCVQKETLCLWKLPGMNPYNFINFTIILFLKIGLLDFPMLSFLLHCVLV